MISRLCGGQRQLNSDRAGRLRFFGPTSSLHLSENVTSSVLIREPHSSRGHYQWQDTLPLETQNHLLELYWKYQHMTLPIIHKEGLSLSAPHQNCQRVDTRVQPFFTTLKAGKQNTAAGFWFIAFLLEPLQSPSILIFGH